MENQKQEKATKTLTVKRRVVEISNKLKVAKSGKNTFAKYEYTTPEDIMKVLNPLLLEYNVISIFNMERMEGNNFIGKLTIEDCNTDEKIEYKFEIPFTEVKGASPAQAMGATFTYCKRYTLMNVFNIAGDDDLDKVIDGKNVKEVKKEDSLPTVKNVVERIKACETVEQIEKAKEWISTKDYNEAQKNVINRAIEEQEKICA